MKRHQIEHIVPIICLFLSLILIQQFYKFDTPRNIGLACTILGLAIWGKAKIDLGELFTRLPEAKGLMTKGIYQYLRHPIYLGISLMLLGWFLLSASPVWAFVLIVFVLISIIRIHFEEKSLARKFKKRYQEYKKKTLF